MTDSNTPKLPDVWSIPQQAIREWLELDASAPLNIELTRQTVDSLFFGLMRLADAQSQFHACLISYSNGDTATANAKLVESQTTLIEGQNRLRQFVTDIMLSATRGA